MKINPSEAHVFFNGHGGSDLALKVVMSVQPHLRGKALSVIDHDVKSGWKSESDILAYSHAVLFKIGAIPKNFKEPGAFKYETQEGSAYGQDFFIFFIEKKVDGAASKRPISGEVFESEKKWWQFWK